MIMTFSSCTAKISSCSSVIKAAYCTCYLDNGDDLDVVMVCHCKLIVSVRQPRDPVYYNAISLHTRLQVNEILDTCYISEYVSLVRCKNITGGTCFQVVVDLHNDNKTQRVWILDFLNVCFQEET